MKTAIINFRTTYDLKARLAELARNMDGYTMTRLLEEGVELVLAKYSGGQTNA